MNFTPAAIIKQITEFWNKQSKKARIITISAGVAVIVIAVLVAVLLNNKPYTVLYRGLSSSEGAEILTKLQGMSVDAKVENDGTILVPDNQVAKLKMQLASEGYPKTTLSYDVFTSNTNFMTTDYQQQKYLLFQLQNRLQDTIKMTIGGVENAIVTISVADNNSFVLQSDKVDSTASVALTLLGDTKLTKQQILGIQELVAKSVPGLTDKNVVIVDGNGVVLNSSLQDGTGDATTQQALTNSVNEAMKNKLVGLLAPVFGNNGMSVAVNATIDFQKKSSETTTYTPSVGENGMIGKQSTTEQTQGTSSGAQGVPGTSTNTGVDTYPSTSSEASGGTTINKTSDTDYLVNQAIEKVQNDGGEIKSLTVAVVINSKTLSETELQKYTKLVAFGAGISTDNVVVTSAEFAGNKTQNPGGSTAALPFSLTTLAIGAGGIIVILVVILIVMLFAKRKKAKQEEEADEIFDERYPAVEGKPYPDSKVTFVESAEDPGEIVINETREQALKRQIKDFSSTNPEIVAQLIRTWIKEESN